ncbi:hypothetical protein GUJ93_ZPchr0006g44244 [Zizania palustris]|uniref:Uncharacterized protein n=1 Tax=Zizania palustris TaxID=103762 RepID=A0A8J5S969_ZIZPA|nr:hypothetical protein GUJ93_ZPchr0006g44244 [Zizania palustris]
MPKREREYSKMIGDAWNPLREDDIHQIVKARVASHYQPLLFSLATTSSSQVPTPGSHESPSHFAPAADAADEMDEDAITALMDIDDSPRSTAAGAVFLDDEEDAEVFPGHRTARGGNGTRVPLHFTGFYNSFDGADFDDTDLA